MRIIHRKFKGFTLIELMLVVAIMGLLSAIAIPKFANMVRKAQEAAIYGSLGGIRSAVSIYYADNEGLMPSQLGIEQALTAGSRYLSDIPRIHIPGYSHVAYATVFGAEASPHGDNGWWYYRATSTGFYQQGVYVSCSHTDLKGQNWGPPELWP